jgi:hypothetical protein
VLRKAINFSDCTVCLDKRNASGKIEFYQDPLLYKCSFRTRLHFTYDNLNSKMPSVIKVSISVSSSLLTYLYFVYWLLCMVFIMKIIRGENELHIYVCAFCFYKRLSISF